MNDKLCVVSVCLIVGCSSSSQQSNDFVSASDPNVGVYLKATLARTKRINFHFAGHEGTIEDPSDIKNIVRAFKEHSVAGGAIKGTSSMEFLLDDGTVREVRWGSRRELEYYDKRLPASQGKWRIDLKDEALYEQVRECASRRIGKHFEFVEGSATSREFAEPVRAIQDSVRVALRYSLVQGQAKEVLLDKPSFLPILKHLNNASGTVMLSRGGVNSRRIVSVVFYFDNGKLSRWEIPMSVGACRTIMLPDGSLFREADIDKTLFQVVSKIIFEAEGGSVDLIPLPSEIQ